MFVYSPYKYRNDDDDDYYDPLGYGKPTDHLASTIYEADSKPIYTGLLDKHGVKLYKVEKKNPIGFR